MEFNGLTVSLKKVSYSDSQCNLSHIYVVLIHFYLIIQICDFDQSMIWYKIAFNCLVLHELLTVFQRHWMVADIEEETFPFKRIYGQAVRI